MSITLVGTASNHAASGTDANVTHGLSIQAGDFVLASVHANNDDNHASDDNGVASFTKDDWEDSNDSAVHSIFSRVAGASEPAAYHFTLAQSARWSLVIRVYRGVDASKYDVAPGVAVARATNSTPATAPSIDIVTPGACGIVIVSGDKAPTTTTWSNPTNSYGNEREASGQQTQATYDRLGLSAGAVGAVSVTPSGTDETWIAFHFALKPASSATYLPQIMRTHYFPPLGGF